MRDVVSWVIIGLSTFVDSYRKLTQLQPADVKPLDIPHFIYTMSALYPEVKWHVDLNNVATVSTDQGMLRQVATNIIKNAIEAGARSIDLRIADDEGTYHNSDNGKSVTRLLISNDGQRIAPEVAREIFIPFFTTKKTGQGIGLSLARQMMIACGGDLWLADTPVAGFHTTFIVEI